MATLYACDRCKKSIEATEEEHREWTAITLSKIKGPIFQSADLCADCTTGLRRFLAQAVN